MIQSSLPTLGRIERKRIGLLDSAKQYQALHTYIPDKEGLTSPGGKSLWWREETFGERSL
jgi:hypothetical protein